MRAAESYTLRVKDPQYTGAYLNFLSILHKDHDCNRLYMTLVFDVQGSLFASSPRVQDYTRHIYILNQQWRTSAVKYGLSRLIIRRTATIRRCPGVS